MIRYIRPLCIPDTLPEFQCSYVCSWGQDLFKMVPFWIFKLANKVDGHRKLEIRRIPLLLWCWLWKIVNAKFGKHHTYCSHGSSYFMKNSHTFEGTNWEHGFFLQSELTNPFGDLARTLESTFHGKYIFSKSVKIAFSTNCEAKWSGQIGTILMWQVKIWHYRCVAPIGAFLFQHTHWWNSGGK